MNSPLQPKTIVRVRRHWNDWKIGEAQFGKLFGFRWDTISGGVGVRSPRPMIHCTMQCTDLVSGEIAHSGVHGPCPHNVKVVIVKKDNSPEVIAALVTLCGERH